MGRKKSRFIRFFNNIASKSMHAQSAMEFISTYSWALIVIAVIIALLYFYVAAPQQFAPSQCAFSAGVNCNNLVIGTNSISTTLTAFLTNTQQHSIKNSTIIINITNIGTVKAPCKPYFVLSGGIMICTVNLPQTIGAGASISGKLYASENVCAGVSQQICTTSTYEKLAGTYSIKVGSSTLTPSCTVTLSLPSNLIAFVKNPVVATVKIQGRQVAGATVNFTANTLNANVLPEFVATDNNGNATSYVTSNQAGNVAVNASTGICNSTQATTFSSKPLVTFQTNLPNLGIQVLTLDNIYYSNLPQTFVYPYGSVHSYSFNGAIAVPGFVYTYNSISGCGVGSQSGNLIATATCTVLANYIATTYLYVTTSSALLVINSRTGATMQTVSVGSSLTDLWLTPDGKYAYIASTGDNKIYNMTLSRAYPSHTISSCCGSGIKSVIVSPSGPLAFGWSDTAVYKVNTGPDTVGGTLSGGYDAVAISADGSTAYVSTFTNDILDLVNTATLSVNPISVGVCTGDVVPIAILNAVYIAGCSGSNNVYVFSTLTNTITNTISVGNSPDDIAASPDGKYVYVVNNGANSVSVIKTSTNTVIATVPVGGNPDGIAADNGHVYITNQNDGSISIINSTTNQVTSTITGITNIQDVAVV